MTPITLEELVEKCLANGDALLEHYASKVGNFKNEVNLFIMQTMALDVLNVAAQAPKLVP